MCFHYDEQAEFYEESYPKARKSHQCEGCAGQIAIGERYSYGRGKYDGSFFTVAVCRRCEYEIAKIAAHELDEGCRWHEAWCNPGDLTDYLADSDQELTPAELVPEWFRVDIPKEEMMARLRTKRDPVIA